MTLRSPHMCDPSVRASHWRNVEFTKSERGELRGLSGAIYEVEAGRIPNALDVDIQRWRDGKLPSANLIEIIHQFHQHPARELWSEYQAMKEYEIAARSLAMGLVGEDAVSPELLAKLKPIASLYGA